MEGGMDSFGARDGGVKGGVFDDSGNDIVDFWDFWWGFLCGLGLVFCGPGREDGPAKLDDFFENLLSGFEDHNFFTGDESENSVRGVLDEFDEVGIDRQGVIVEAGELDHSGSNPWRMDGGRKGRDAS